MRNLNLMAAVAATLLAGGVAVAREKPADAPKAKKICKGEENSNSRIQRRKVCRTQAEWNQLTGPDGMDGAEGKLRGMSRGN